MKGLKMLILLGMVCFLFVGVAFSADITVSAKVPNTTPTISIVIKELTSPDQNPWDGTTVTSMDFDQLTHTLSDGSEAGLWYSPKYFCVLIFTNSYGHKYEIRSSCGGLTSGTNSLPAGSFGVVPGYSSSDRWVGNDPNTAQGDQPTGSSLGSAGPAITGAGAYRVIYSSEPAGSNRIIRAFYSIPCYKAGGAAPYSGYQPIPLTQPAGNYSGTVTITIVAVG